MGINVVYCERCSDGVGFTWDGLCQRCLDADKKHSEIIIEARKIAARMLAPTVDEWKKKVWELENEIIRLKGLSNDGNR